MPAPLNRTLTLSDNERKIFREKLIKIKNPVNVDSIINKVINQDFLKS